jgi:uncharacterized protein
MKMRLAAVAMLLLPLCAHAASFACAKAGNAAEKAVCADEQLSRLDSDLGKAYARAVTATADPAALRSAQRAWLKERDACGADQACLRQSYERRLSDIAGSGTTAAADAWQGQWELDSRAASVGGVIDITGNGPAYHFSLSANNGANTGALEGDFTVANGRASFKGGEDAPACRLDFALHGQRLTLDQHQTDCGAGMGVYFGGNYLPARVVAARPQPDLASMKLLDAAQNEAARRLLGKQDYDTLLATANLCGGIDDKDGLGAKVTDCFVRGLANTNAAVMMAKGTQLWIGLLVFDKRNQSRMRYYTNVPAWKQKLPRTIQAWHDQHDAALPIDKMP